jgi:hypothetical protein
MKKTQRKQLNVKCNNGELEQMQALNEKLFDGKLNRTEMGAFLLQVAFDCLANAKIKKATVMTINGMPVQV